MKLNNSKMKFIIKTLISLGFLIFASLATSCDTTNPPSSQKLTLTAEDASCTEVWLNLKTENIALPTEIKLMQNDSTVSVSNINSNDTTLFVENLLPSQTYIFQASSIKYQVSSIKVPVTTMDTTSHYVSWESFVIGDRGVLRDVAIINENNIWVVGEIYVDTASGSGLHNAAHWNGNKWEIKKIEYIYNDQGWIAPLYSIFAINTDDIWVGSNQPMHWNGEKWEQFDLTSSVFNGWINKTWATSNNQVYIVGNEGNMAIYDGTTWHKLKSNTEVDLIDVWGSEDGSVVWACGYDSGYLKTVLLRIENGEAQKLYEGDSYGENNGYGVGLFGGLYGKRDNIFLMNTGWIFKQRNEDRLNVRFLTDITTWRYSIDGNDVNDIFVSGQQGLVGHYNGYSYKEYEEFKRDYLYLYSLDVQEKTIAIVGVQHLGVGQNNCVIIIGIK